jgi:hypothetical protein
MAGDWIKFDTDLPEKGEVWQMAGLLKIDPDAVVGKLLKVWRWFDKHTEDGNAPNVTYPLLDSLVGVTGFAEAMVFAGWLEQRGRDLCLPNFDRHNGKTAKNRALTAKRVAKMRNGDVTPAPLAREEKKREEKKEQKQPPATPPADLLPGLPADLVADFLVIRKAKRQPLTPTAVAGLQREASKAGLSLTEAVRVCCERGWAGFNVEWYRNAGGADAKPARRLKELG